MYGLEYREVPANAWHEDVKAYEVVSDGRTIGKFYLDLYPRDGKYKHAAEFTVRQGKRLADGSYQTPMAALECNFPRPARPGEPPAVMEHGDVTVFFHEFGHVLHHILTQSELATYAGTNAVQSTSSRRRRRCSRSGPGTVPSSTGLRATRRPARRSPMPSTAG